MMEESRGERQGSNGGLSPRPPMHYHLEKEVDGLNPILLPGLRAFWEHDHLGRSAGWTLTLPEEDLFS